MLYTVLYIEFVNFQFHCTTCIIKLGVINTKAEIYTSINGCWMLSQLYSPFAAFPSFLGPDRVAAINKIIIKTDRINSEEPKVKYH